MWRMEKIHLCNFRKARAQLFYAVMSALVLYLGFPHCLMKRFYFGQQFVVILLSSGMEKLDHVLFAESLEALDLHHQRFALGLLDFLRHPLEGFQAIVPVGQDEHAAFRRRRADALQSAP